eukprot:3860151-Rhodomonas_salina.2
MRHVPLHQAETRFATSGVRHPSQLEQQPGCVSSVRPIVVRDALELDRAAIRKEGRVGIPRIRPRWYDTPP